MRVKICGITRASDGVAAAEAGADAVGLNFVGGPRRLAPAAAREILRELPPLVTPVALVRIQPGGLPGELLDLFGEFRVSHLQAYGPAHTDGGAGRALASPDDWAGLMAAGFRVMPVLAVKDAGFVSVLKAWSEAPGTHRPSAVVLDAYDPVHEGGTGQTFNWTWLAQYRNPAAANRLPVLLAGGLRPENVAEAVRIARPYGVDVASGVEPEGCPGIKDRARMIAFVRNARTAAIESLESV